MRLHSIVLNWQTTVVVVTYLRYACQSQTQRRCHSGMDWAGLGRARSQIGLGPSPSRLRDHRSPARPRDDIQWPEPARAARIWPDVVA